ncbi:hypothetical protein niasHS_001149 [Heterodera schachtii]|uniref:Transposase n=1 Tax=Heterodera schachtii TaxID=97005 RepID=A0ABD2KD07_HETSC
MPTVREILESLQKPIKRPRNPTNEDSVLNAERTAAEQQMEGVSTSNDLNVGDSDDEENCEPVHFQRGKTIRGALCLWHQGFRFLKIRSDGSWFRCERRNCPATAKLEDEECDFETGMLKAMRHVFPSCERSGCNFHMAQALFRKARSMGIFHLFAENNAEALGQRKSVHKTFRSVLSLALIPPLYIRQAFKTIINEAPFGVQGWLAYFGKNYIGATQFEIDHGAEAFEPNADVGRLFLRRTRSTTPFSVSQASIMTGSGAIQFGLHSPQPSTPTIPLSEESSLQLIRRWEHAIVRPPRFSISFWNVHTRAQMALERTNNGMEAAHGQFARELNHHPSLSDFIAAFTKDIDKQLDIGRAEQLQKSRKRPQRYIIKEQNVVRILDEADFESEEGLTNSLHLLGLVMQGFAEGLHVRGNSESGEETEADEN